MALIYKYERHRYRAFHGFNFLGRNTLPFCQVFPDPVCLELYKDIPCAFFSDRSYEEALEIVKQHGHPESYVHLATRTLIKPPAMVKTTRKKRKLSPVRSTYNLRKRARDKK